MPSRVHGLVQETPRTRGRRGCDEVNVAEGRSSTKMKKTPKKRATRVKRWAGSGGNGGRHGPTTKKQLTATVARRTERWKSILWNRSVLSEHACCGQMKSAGARPGAFAGTSYFERVRNKSDSLVKSEQREKIDIYTLAILY